MGDDWCGKALGEGHSAIIFEGGWLDPYMKDTYPDVKYAWAEMPAGPAGKATLAFTVAYSMGVDSKNKDASWVLISYLTGPEGMKTWTEGGIANPSRSDLQGAPGKEILIQGAEYANPWSFIPGFTEINDAFNNALTAAIEGPGRAGRRDRDQGRDRLEAQVAPPATGPAVRRPRPDPTGGGRMTAAATRRPAVPSAACVRSGDRRRSRLRVHRRPDRPVPRPQHRPDLLRAATSALGLGYARPASSSARQLPDAARRPGLLEGDPEHPLLRGDLVPLQMAIGLFLAVIVNQKIRGQTFFRAAFYFPAIASSAAITVLWLFIFAPDGLFNGVRERARASTRCSSSSGSAPTRTGSATAGRPSTR